MQENDKYIYLMVTLWNLSLGVCKLTIEKKITEENSCEWLY